MSQTSHMLDTLKRCLRAKGLNYRDVAEALDLSESSIKRLFSEKTFSLQRLEDVCRYLEMSIYDLARMAATRDDQRHDELSDEQEQALADDPILMSYFYLLLVGWSVPRIGRRLALNQVGQNRYLTRLDRLRLIELQPRNRARLLTDSRIRWNPKGPVRRRYEQRVKDEFVAHRFDTAHDTIKLESAELSDASIMVLQRRIDRFAEEFAELTEIDRSLPADQKRGFGILIGARPWTFWNIVDGMIRDQIEAKRSRAR